MLPLAESAASLGLAFKNVVVLGVPSLDIAQWEVVTFDLYRSTATNGIVGNSSGSFSRVIRPTGTSVYGGPPHAIALESVTRGHVGKFLVFGVAKEMSLPSGAVAGSALAAGGNVAGVRVFGLVLDKKSSTVGDVLWNGLCGFGQVAGASGGGNTPPVAALTATPSSGDTPLAVTLDASGSTDSDGSITKYEFNLDIGGGWIDNGLDADLVYTYQFAGTYDPAVRVTDNSGAQDIASARVVVTDPSSGGAGDEPESPPDSDLTDGDASGDGTTVIVIDDV